MPTLNNIQKIYDQFISSAIEIEYSTDNMSKPNLEEIKKELIKTLEEYCEEIKNDMRKNS